MNEQCDNQEFTAQRLRPITGAVSRDTNSNQGKAVSISQEMNRNKDVGGYFNCGVSNNNISNMNSNNSNIFSGCGDESLDINVRNLENLTLMDNLNNVTNSISGLENNENLYFQDFDSVLNPYIDDPKEGNISRTVRVPSSEHVAEIVGRQGCKIKDLRARTNTYIKTPMRTQSPVFVVTGKEEAVLHVMEEIQNAAEHFTHIRASRNQHKSASNGIGVGGLEVTKPVSREGDIMIQVTVPYRVVGLVVGLKGQTIKAIQQDTDTFIVTPNRDKAPIFEIRGQPESVERAKSMILRHIETRTRHCRLQDNTNLPGSWSSASGLDENTNGGSSSGSGSGGMNDFSMFQQNNGNNEGIGSSSIMNHSGGISGTSNGYNCNNNFNNSSGSLMGNRLYGNNFSSSASPPSNGNFGSSWNSYPSTNEQHRNTSPTQQHTNSAHSAGGPMTTWSSAASDFNPMMNSVNEPSPYSSGSSNNGMNSSMRSSHFGNYHGLNMGSISSSSNSSSVSPPQDFANEGHYSTSGQHGLSMMPFCSSVGASPPLHRMNPEASTDAPDFTGFPLLSNGSSSPSNSKGSLVLGNLFRSSNSGASSGLGMQMLSSSGSSSSSNSSNHSNASPTSANGFHQGDDLLHSLAAAGFSATGPGTAAAAPVCTLGISSTYTHGLEPQSLFSGASSGAMHLMLQDSSNGGIGESSSTVQQPDARCTGDGSASQNSPTPRLCRVCDESEVVAALVPCGHNLFCMECAVAITNRPVEDERKCPVCEEHAVNVLRIRA